MLSHVRTLLRGVSSLTFSETKQERKTCDRAAGVCVRTAQPHDDE